MRFAFCLCLALTLLAGPAGAELKLSNPTEIATISTQWPLGLAASGETLYVAYVDSKGAVNVRTYDKDGKHGSNFPDPAMPSEVTASWNPALAVKGSTLYAAFRSGNYSDSKDQPIYVASYDLSQGARGSWSSFTNVHDQGVYGKSDHAPALAVAGSKLWLVGKNDGKHAISQAWLDGSKWSSIGPTTCWPEKSPYDAWGTPTKGFPTSCSSNDKKLKKYAKDQILSPNPGVPQTPQAPSLTYDGTHLQLAYRGGVYAGDDRLKHLWLLTGDTSGKGWGKPVQISNFESRLAPAIVSVGSDLGVFFSNHADSDNLAFSASTGSGWSQPIKVGKQPDTRSSKASAPTAAPFTAAGKIAYSIIRGGGKTATLYFADYSK